jgi:hypothetical protein
MFKLHVGSYSRAFHKDVHVGHILAQLLPQTNFIMSGMRTTISSYAILVGDPRGQSSSHQFICKIAPILGLIIQPHCLFVFYAYLHLSFIFK